MNLAKPIGICLMAILLLAACATSPEMAAPPRDKALHKLFEDSDEASLRLNPIGALYRNDPRYAAEFGDYITDDYIAALVRQADDEARRLSAIDRTSLSPQDRIAYDVFAYQNRMSREGLQPGIVALNVVRPINHFSGLHTQVPDINSGKSAAPYVTVEDYENGLKRMDGFATWLDRAVDRMKQGVKAGVVETRLTTREMIVQFNDLIAQGVEKSPFWGPIDAMPAEFSETDRNRLKQKYRDMMNNRIIPAYTRMRDYLETSYLPKARAGAGLVHMKGGKRLYEFLVRDQTTTSMTADEIHALGLKEVARIRREMDGIRRSVGFKGNLQAFFTHLRNAREFEPASRDDLMTRYDQIAARVEAVIRNEYALLPKTPLELRPVPDYLEQSQAAGYYNQGAPDASRPGIFYFNTYDLPSRKVWGMETLYLHEAVPGHHFQISLAQENTGLPNFMRFGGNTAYVEGWALYAEWTGRTLGMFKDPYQLFGHLNDEQLRALRLVVDTGIHARGWSRERAIRFMLDNSALSRTETVQEVDRYIAIPGQALGYKIGQITIKRLRAEAEAALGPRFDIRAFHAEVLNTGALPLEVLEAKIRTWIANQAASPTK